MITGITQGDASHAAPGAAQGWHVYILLCADGTLYTGCTTDVTRRLREHNGSRRGARYTRTRQPVELLRSWPFPDRSAAQREEARIKRLTRAQKWELATGPAR